MTIQLIIYILFLHWLFDFPLQTDTMALNKSSSFYWLTQHTAVYSLWGCLIGLSAMEAMYFIMFLFVTHTVIDGITSKGTSYLWQKNQRHWFFVLIGFDQFLHYATIFAYIGYIKGVL